MPTMPESTMQQKRPEAAEVTPAERTRTGRCYRPAVDILETDDELIVRADMPGTRSEDIDLDFEKGLLTIDARVADRDQGRGYALCEYGVGDFYRTFAVSEAVDASRISAEYCDGTLTIHLPKLESAKRRKIEVRAK